jgi:hypothetical protein
MRTMVASGDEVESSREMVETWRGWDGPRILIWLSSTLICIYPVKKIAFNNKILYGLFKKESTCIEVCSDDTFRHAVM